jgi:DNA-binding transcriptional LysR family regulator
MAFDNRISLYKLEVFRLVAEMGGVGRAASHLFVSQPVVTAHIRSLEERLGVKLFYREGRLLRLTEAGNSVYKWASEISTRSREIERELVGLSDGTRGAVVVAAGMSVGSYMLPPVVTEFAKTHPGADITLNVSDPDHVLEAVEAGACDFALMIAERFDDHRNLEHEKIGEEDLILVAAPQGLPAGKSVSTAELARLPFVCSPKGFVRRRLEDDQLEGIGLSHRKAVIELGHPEAMKRAAREGLGVTLLFRSAVEEDLAAGLLREIRIEDVRFAIPVFLVRRPGKNLSPVQAALQLAIKEHVGVRSN